MKRLNFEGKVTGKQLLDVIDVFMDHPDLPSEKEVLAELTPIVKRRLRGDAIRRMIDQHGKGDKGDLVREAQQLLRIEQLGETESSVGVQLGHGSFNEMAQLRVTNRMPYGILELDAALRGGLPRGSQAVVIAASNAGKSMMLAHQAASCIKHGYFVAMATTELSRAEQLCRIKANLTGIFIDSLEEGEPTAIDECEEKLEYMFGTLGSLIVEDFPADVATMLDIRHWFKECQSHVGHKPHVLIVDYGDELKSHNKDDHNSYERAGTVFSDMRSFAKQELLWAYTASQPQRKAAKERGRYLELDDVADSLKKIRKADQVITINPDKSGDQLTYKVAKNRRGKKGMLIGPLPHDFARGRMVVEYDGQDP